MQAQAREARKTLRPHQQRAIDMLRASLASGKRRPMLQAPVGFGKTLVAATITRQAREKGKRVLFIVDAVSLVDQTVRAFWAEGVEGIGVIQADHVMKDWSRPVQVASVQTLESRDRMPDADLIIVDEAHTQNRWLLRTIADEKWRRVPVLGLSATPWSKGLGRHYDDLLKPATLAQLTPAFNPPITAYAPGDPDLSTVQVRAGEFNQDQLSRVMRDNVLIADIVETWADLGEDRPTFAFCVDCAHAQDVQARFRQAGIGCGYIDGKTPAPERETIKGQLDRGEIRVVASVGALVKGVDWKVSCIIAAAPTKSPMKWVQSVGRGLRQHPEWSDLILLDHAGNTLRKGLGLPTNIDFDEMCDAKPGEKSKLKTGGEKGDAERKPCPKCHFLLAKRQRECPKCHHVPPAASDLAEGAGVLALVGGSKSGPAKPAISPAEKERFYAEALSYCLARGKNPNAASHMVRERFGHFPARKAGVIPVEPSPATLNWIKAKAIRYAKSRAKAA